MNGKRLVWCFVLAAVVGAACGGGLDTSVAACTVGTGTSKTCTEYNASGEPAIVDEIRTACTQNGGTASDACSHAGAVGGCRVTPRITSWRYAGDATSEMRECTNGGGTWIAP